jgi:hypothetical protein
MPSIYSDPQFGRGQTLLGGSAVDVEVTGLPSAGGEAVGAVKVFPDAAPGTGPAAIRYSNRLVYCIAARYVGSTTLNPGNLGADRGKWVVLDRASPLATFSGFAAAASAAAGRLVGVLDEYLMSEVRTNDIVWIVVRGPCQAAKAANTAISVTSSNANLEPATGLTALSSTVANYVGQSIDPFGTVDTTAASGTGTGQTVPVSTTLANYNLLQVGLNISGTNVPSNATITSVSQPVINGTTVTATLGLSGSVSTAVASGTTLTIGGPTYAGTFCRVNVTNCSV